jgi:hypothetical protein
MDACLSLEVFPSMMEYLPASDEDAVAASLRMVDGADIYIGIFANRYGYVPQGTDVSITEMEYQRAIKRKIPVLIFLLHDSALKQSDEPDANQQRLSAFKGHLKQTHVVKFFQTPIDLGAAVIQSLWPVLPDRPQHMPAIKTQDSAQVSPMLQDRFAEANRAIETLTQEQLQVLNMLRYQRRVAIAGCAGSGKTLIAVEKAVRLDKAGVRTLIMCHNRYLANYIQTLIRGTGIFIIDFTSWVNRLLHQEPVVGTSWTHYEEPTDEELTQAFDNLVASDERYDAILVDEGQDFRAEWWLIIEAALANAEYGIFYIFYDDNQALLPDRASYPIKQLPFVLSKNCRNAGAIYEIVRRFHAQSPEPTVTLKDQGVTRYWAYDSGEEHAAIEGAIRHLMELMPPEHIVVLTTQPDPIEQAILYGEKINLLPTKNWQDFITSYLARYGHIRFTLSTSPRPTKEDIRAVKDFAQAHYPREWSTPRELRTTSHWHWINGEHGISLGGSMRLAKFVFDDWADDMPEIKGPEYTLINVGTPTPGTIPYFTVSSYKGLEADGVVLFVPTPRPDLDAIAYVGVSRAKLALEIVAERRVVRYAPHLLGASGS